MRDRLSGSVGPVPTDPAADFAASSCMDIAASIWFMTWNTDMRMHWPVPCQVYYKSREYDGSGEKFLRRTRGEICICSVYCMAHTRLLCRSLLCAASALPACRKTMNREVRHVSEMLHAPDAWDTLLSGYTESAGSPGKILSNHARICYNGGILQKSGN